MPGNLAEIPELPLDEAFALTAAFKADKHPQKVSLGAGVYRDGQGKPWILPSVRETKRILHETENLDHEYLPIQGSVPFLDLAKDLILGKSLASSVNAVSVQTISGTGANHVGAQFLSQQLKPRHVFISDPTWNNHHLVWTVGAPGVKQKTYPYYDAATQSLDFDGMIKTLEDEGVENDVVILHACAHNPTGIDPTQQQWQEIAQVVRRKKLFAFFDCAYQGFATGDPDIDAGAVRYFTEAMFSPGGTMVKQDGGPAGMCIAQSFAKNFGLYGERVGAFHLVLPSSTPNSGAYSQLLRLGRAEISNPPLFGARVVHTILSSSELRSIWLQDLKTMAQRIGDVRATLRRQIESRPHSGDWGHLESQIGMFSFTGLNEKQVLRLRHVHHIYLMLNGRASLSGVNQDNVEYVAAAFNEVVRYGGDSTS
ncbi:hypothetical protein B0A52_04540 [Exophiala mesophila]|uniref:Aspartate aminotransferase n=1 Tax=Exophiala mesophila TaxID=212818 RepID=A0A438N997_EXOME|nr:hypothetical protein B0A52_04540 [Exophiala mesophila]